MLATGMRKTHELIMMGNAARGFMLALSLAGGAAAMAAPQAAAQTRAQSLAIIAPPKNF